MMDLEKLAENALKEKQEGKGLTQLAELQRGRRKEFANLDDLEVDEVYRTLIRKQTAEEQNQLRTSILSEGIRDAIVVYNREGQLVVVDGHHRLMIAKELNFPTVPIEEREFSTVDDARIWMLRNQLGRRNLNDAERIEIALQLTAFMEKIGLENKLQGKDINLIQARTITVFSRI